MKYPRLLLLLLTITLLFGCAASPTVETTLPPATETIAPTVPETTVSAPPELIPELSPDGAPPDTGKLLSTRPFAASPDVAVLDERTAAFLTTQYDKDAEVVVSNLMVLDLYSDTVLAETAMNCALAFPVQSRLPGYLPVYDHAGGRWIILNKLLETVTTFSCDSGGGVFAPDLSAYYYVSAQRLYRMDPHTGETAALETELTLPVERITDYDPERNILLLDVHTQYYLTDLCVGAVDAGGGAVLMLTDEAEQCTFSSDGVLLEHTALANSSHLIRTGWGDSDGLKFSDVMLRDSLNSSLRIPGTDFQITMRCDPRKNYTVSSVMLYRFRDGYESCELYELLEGMEPDKIRSLPGGNLLFVDYSRSKTRLALVCPEGLTFTQTDAAENCTLEPIDASIVESYVQQSAPVEVPEELAEVRAQADALEERYDITILLSNQCESIITQCGFTLQPTDTAGLTDEARRLSHALEELEHALELYPADFFSQFRNDAHERGILVLLVENISGAINDENVDTLGVTYDMGDWYPIAVDVTTAKLSATYCHEIWHAMENKIMDEEPSLLNDVAWAKLNPQGFSYSDVLEGYYTDTADTFLDGGCGKKSYFVDSYGKTRPQEDRARLMEYVMTTTFSAENMMEAPVLHEKMAMMITAVRGVFDTTGWENVHWERFHPEQ